MFMTQEIVMTQKALADMIGNKTPAAQIRWLESRGYKYDINARGKVLVAIDYVKMRLGVPIDFHANNKPTEPDFSSL